MGWKFRFAFGQPYEAGSMSTPSFLTCLELLGTTQSEHIRFILSKTIDFADDLTDCTLAVDMVLELEHLIFTHIPQSMAASCLVANDSHFG
jgi:hypothetical protein